MEIKITLNGGTNTIIIHNGETDVISSNLKEKGDDAWNEAMDVLECMILSHYSTGVDVTHYNYVKGLELALEVLSNKI